VNFGACTGTVSAHVTYELSQRETDVTRPYNKNIIKVLRLSRDMMLLADRGDESRQDRSCGVLYGTLRDSAYKLRSLAEQEIDVHKHTGLWDED
jgi:hypothetical protein